MRSFGEDQTEIWKEERTVHSLLGKLQKEPTFRIEGLPIYRRPYSAEWIEENRMGKCCDLKIADILELGFYPTKLKELYHEGVDYMIERVTGSFLSATEKKKEFLPRIAKQFSGMRFCNTTVEINPPCAIIRERRPSILSASGLRVSRILKPRWRPGRRIKKM